MRTTALLMLSAGVLAATAAAAHADDLAACKTAAYDKLCKSLRERGQDHCVRSMRIDFSGVKAESQKAAADAFRARVADFKSFQRDRTRFNKKYGHCYDALSYKACKVRPPDREVTPCSSAPVYKESWADYVERFEKRGIDAMKRGLAREKRRRGTPTTFNRTVAGRYREIQHIAQINRETPWIAVDQSRVDGLVKQAKGIYDQVDALMQKRLAKVRCPRPKYRNRGLTRKLRKITAEHLAGLKKKSGTKETLVKFGLMGRPKTKRVSHKRVTHRDIPATLCVRQERGDRATCRIFKATLRRTKPDGGRWGPWEFRSIGGGGLMSCRRLR